ncbi:hypothetical protein CSUI_010023 [Cystoisospora suis]|uniref:Uncharacterized protein n=1 Tax=Cystoisospora suis TaxID=483139 RepID=A0A2C6KIJ3_9APIC|nr:hypothetical protein CSUI_010023 [Cystoisospora suis]
MKSEGGATRTGVDPVIEVQLSEAFAISASRRFHDPMTRGLLS